MLKRLDRGAGVLLPISSLPSPYGIGTMGREAYKFTDELVKAGQKYWQVLPVGPTGYGDSPYQSFSAFAGNPYFIDLDGLIKDELLKLEEVEGISWFVTEEYVEYQTLYENRFPLLRKAFKRWKKKKSGGYQKFVKENFSSYITSQVFKEVIKPEKIYFSLKACDGGYSLIAADSDSKKTYAWISSLSKRFSLVEMIATGIVYVKDVRTDTYQPFISGNGKYCRYDKEKGILVEI